MQVEFSSEGKALMVTLSLRDGSQKPIKRKATEADVAAYDRQYEKFIAAGKAIK